MELITANDAGKLSAVTVTSSSFTTDKGARVGMTVAQVKALYGSAFNPTTDGGESYYARIDHGATSTIFGLDPETDRVDSIVVRNDLDNYSC